MNKRLWSYVYDNLSDYSRIETKECFLCSNDYNSTLTMTNTTNFPLKDRIAAKPRTIHLCKSCLLDSSFNERLDIFAAIAVRRTHVRRSCHVCQKITMRYVIVPGTFKNNYICFDCFVYGNDKVWKHSRQDAKDFRSYREVNGLPMNPDDFMFSEEEFDPNNEDYVYIDNYKAETFDEEEFLGDDDPRNQVNELNENKRKQPEDEDDEDLKFLLDQFDKQLDLGNFDVTEYESYLSYPEYVSENENEDDIDEPLIDESFDIDDYSKKATISFK